MASGGFGDSVRADTASTDLDPFYAAVDKGSNRLDVRLKPPPGDVVGMTDVVSERRSLPTNFTTSRHIDSHPSHSD